MLSFRRPAGLRRGGPARRRRAGVPGAGAGGGEKLRGEVPRQPHHREPGPRRPEKGGHGLRSAHFPGYPGRFGGPGPAAGGRSLFGRAVADGGAAPRAGRAPHGPGRRARRHQNPLRPQRERRRGHPGRRPDGLRRGERDAAGGPSPGRGTPDARRSLAAGGGDGAPAGPAGRQGPGKLPPGPGDRRRRRPQPAAHRQPRRGQVHAGPPPALHPAGHDPAGGAGGLGDLLRRRPDRQPPSPADPPPLPLAPPHGVRRGPVRRRCFAPPGGDLPGPQRRAVPR